MQVVYSPLFKFGYFLDEVITTCFVEVAIHDENKKRPNVGPNYCLDMSPDTCGALFNKLRDTYVTNLNPYAFFDLI